MQKRIVSLVTPFVVGIIALALGWFAHAAVPLAAQGIAVDRRASLADPAWPAAPATCLVPTLITYQGRLTDAAGAAIISTVSVVFKLYDSTPALLWTSATRSITPTNGLFTVYLGDSVDPCLFGNLLSEAASIGVTVDGEVMMPPQPLNTVVGHGYFAGVVGNSKSGTGVLGRSDSGYGVNGSTRSNTAAGVLASGASTAGIALEIFPGSIQVRGAGIDTLTPVFVHQVTAVNINVNATQQTIIDHPLTNGDPFAILIITSAANYGNPGAYVIDPNPIGVYYNPSLSKWVIYNINGSAMLAGQQFNVLVVKP
jgi:hypothetical protein